MERYDAIIIGGGLTGAAAGQLLARRHPDARILIVEEKESHEPGCLPTAEVAGLFLTRRLRLWDYLSRVELPSHGPRFWFHDDEVVRIQGATEVGTWLLPSTPGFLAQEDLLCARLLQDAARAGCEVLRPASVEDVDLRPYDSRVRIAEADGQTRDLAATWVIDASGRATVLGSQLGVIHPNLEHPVASIEGIWRGDLDVDGPVFTPDSDFGRRALVSRRLCANHFQGYGYRVSLRALGGHHTAADERRLLVSILFDKRVLDLHRAEDLGDAYSAFLSGLPAIRQLLQHAELPRQELKMVPQVAYDATELAGPGWALIGAAAGYIDPCCSPASDWAAHTVEATTSIVAAHLAGRSVSSRIERHNVAFLRSHRRTFVGRFRDRYLVSGDFDLFWPAFFMDRALYMLGNVAPVAWRPGRLGVPPLSTPLGSLRALLMRTYSARMRSLARRRMWSGHYGRSNHGQRLGYRVDLGPGSALTLFHGMAGWAVREFENLGITATLVIRRLRGAHSLPEGADLTTLPDGVEILAEAPPSAD